MLREQLACHRQGEEITSQSEACSAVVDQAKDGIVIIQDDVHVLANQAMTAMTGYSKDEIVGMPFTHLVTPENRDLIIERIRLVMRGEEVPQVCEVMIRRKDGETRLVELSTGTVPFNGRAAVTATVRDVAERKSFEQKVRESEEWFRILFEQSPIGILVHDASGMAVRVNRACLDIFGVPDFEQTQPLDLCDDRITQSSFRAAVRAAKTVRYEGSFDFSRASRAIRDQSLKSGIIHIDVMVTPLFSSTDGPVTGYVVYVQDITERKKSQGRLRDLTHRLVEVQETERRRIARELHDQIGQALTGLKLSLETANRLPFQHVKPMLGEAQVSINALIGAVKDLSLDLRPPMLDDLGLLPTLLWLFQRYTDQTSVRVAFRHSGLDRRFSPELETTVYRIVTEALANIASHSGAHEASVRAVASGRTLTLQIEDDGLGFDSEAALMTGKGSGLVGMHERAFSLGGHLSIESACNTGTRLTAELPMQTASEPLESRIELRDEQIHSSRS